jgi:hypothetical protein
MRALVLAIALAITLSACDGQSDPATKSTRSTSSAATSPTPSAVLSKAALTQADVPAGWTPSPELVRGDGQIGDYDPAACLAIRHPLEKHGTPLSEVRVSFTSKPQDRSIGETITSWPEPVPLVQQVADAVRQCTRFTLTPKEDNPLTLEAQRVSVPGLTEAIVVRVTIDNPGEDLVQYHLYAVRGNHALEFWAYGPQLPEDIALQFARKAMTKFDKAVG